MPAPGTAARVAEILADVRMRLQSLLESELETTGVFHLLELAKLSALLAQLARGEGSTRLERLATVFGNLAQELADKSSFLRGTVLRTLGNGADALEALGHEITTRPPVPDDAKLILVVDDDAQARWTILSALATAGLKVVCADAAPLGLRLLELNRFDLILLDYAMPDMDGRELLERLRALPTNRQTPVVFVTGHEEVELRGRAQAGEIPADLISKPFLPAELALKALACFARAPIE